MIPLKTNEAAEVLSKILHLRIPMEDLEALLRESRLEFCVHELSIPYLPDSEVRTGLWREYEAWREASVE